MSKFNVGKIRTLSHILSEDDVITSSDKPPQEYSTNPLFFKIVPKLGSNWYALDLLYWEFHYGLVYTCQPWNTICQPVNSLQYRVARQRI